MPINPLQLPGMVKATPVDWSSLDRLGDAFAARADRRRADEQRARETTAFGQYVDGISEPGSQPAGTAPPNAGANVAGLGANSPRGVRNNNPGDIIDGPFAKSLPGYAGSDGKFARFATPDHGFGAMDVLLQGYGRRGLNTARAIIARWAPTSDGNNVPAYASFVANGDPDRPIDMNDPNARRMIADRMAQFENGRAVPRGAPANASTAPGATGSTSLATVERAIPPAVAQRIKALYAGGGDGRKYAIALLQKYSASEAPTDEIKEYNLAVRQGETRNFTDWKTGLRRASATNVNVDTKGEGAFESEFGKAQAKRWSGYISAGDAAEGKLSDIAAMREISRRLGSQGAVAGLKEALGPYAQSLGINVDGLSDVQAYSSIIQRLAPQQRAPGSGSTSDVEFKGMLKSMPGLMANPEAREAILDFMESSARQDVARAAIATRLATKEITRADAERALRGLGDPMQRFKAWRRANPQLYGQALRQADQPSPSASGTAPLPGGQHGGAAKHQAAPVRVQSPDDARRLTPGTRFITPDGREFIR
jgi:hypothetical protein